MVAKMKEAASAVKLLQSSPQAAVLLLMWWELRQLSEQLTEVLVLVKVAVS